VLKVNGELVLTNVWCATRRPANGAGLEADDFALWENGKEQRVATFDFESWRWPRP